MQLAKTQNLDLPTQVDAKHKADMDRLRSMNGAAQRERKPAFPVAVQLEMPLRGLLDQVRQLLAPRA